MANYGEPTNNAVHILASASGASIAPAQPPRDIVSFKVGRDGGVAVNFANGEILRTPRTDDTAPSLREYSAAVVSMLAVLVPDGRFRAGITYHRRLLKTGPENHKVIFTEAGR